MNKKVLVYGSALLGLIFMFFAFVYWSHSAGSLPTYLPGYKAGSNVLHFKHGLASFVLALVLFIFAWFKSGEKSSN
jgi:hypothetical protein